MADDRIIIARRLEIHDATGKPRLVLGISGKGDPSIQMFDREGRELVTLAITASSTQGSSGVSRAGAEFRMAASNDGGQVEIQVGANDAWLELLQGEGSESSEILLEVERSPDGGDRAAAIHLADDRAAIEIQIQGGKFNMASGRDEA